MTRCLGNSVGPNLSANVNVRTPKARAYWTYLAVGLPPDERSWV